MSPPVERPLTLGELLAETIRIYGERLWAALGLGAVYTGAVLGSALVHVVLYFAVASLMVVATYGAAARLVLGDTLREAWGQVAVRLPVVLVLALVVGLPFVLASSYLLLVLLAALWIAFTGFSVPVAVTERNAASSGWVSGVSYALVRTIALARAEYLHAAGVAAALLLANLLIANVLGSALVGFADLTRLVAGLVAQLVLAPFFYLGLSVLYFEQRARAALSSRRQPASMPREEEDAEVPDAVDPERAGPPDAAGKP
jgi:hypothetical protein